MSVITVPYKGKDWTLKELAKLSGITRNTLYQRIAVLGWTVEQAVNIPIGNKGIHEYQGEYYSVSQLAQLNGTITASGMAGRLQKVNEGLMTMEEAVKTPCVKRRRRGWK